MLNQFTSKLMNSAKTICNNCPTIECTMLYHRVKTTQNCLLFGLWHANTQDLTFQFETLRKLLFRRKFQFIIRIKISLRRLAVISYFNSNVCCSICKYRSIILTIKSERQFRCLWTNKSGKICRRLNRSFRSGTGVS